MPDLTKEERERLARAAGWELAPHGVWVPVKRIQEFLGRDWRRKANDELPVLTTDELFGLMNSLYPRGWVLKMRGKKAAMCWVAAPKDERDGLDPDASGIGHYSEDGYDASPRQARLALERAVLAGLERGDE